MKSKNIKNNINNKLTDWLNSIDGLKINLKESEIKSFKKTLKSDTLVTGGCIASMLLDEKVNDYDVYFTNKETVKEVAEFYINLLKEYKKEYDYDFYDDDVKILDGEKFNEDGTEMNYNLLSKLIDEIFDDE